MENQKNTPMQKTEHYNSLYHKDSHYGGAGQFERITGFKYGTEEAIKYCEKFNNAYKQ